MPSSPTFRLTCSICHWVPDDRLSMGVVRAHYETEHSDVDLPEDSAAAMNLEAFCSHCDTAMGDPTIHGVRHSWECPNCKRSYAVKVGRQ